MKKNIYVISGGPGSGKSTLIHALGEERYYCAKDVAREFIEEQKDSGGQILPSKNREQFHEVILDKRIEQYKKAPPEELSFFDRGVPDLIGYFLQENMDVPEEYYEAAKNYRHQERVFLTPPWQDLFKQDKARKETFAEAKEIHHAIEGAYRSLDYSIMEVPKKPVRERVDFILSKIDER